MADWVGTVKRNFEKHVRKVENDLLRERVLLAALKKAGRITFNWSGTKLDWRVKFKRAPLLGYADADTVTFARRNRYQVPELPYRGYILTESYTKREKLSNIGTEGIAKLASLAEELTEDISEQFSDELYGDGNATGNEKKIHGFESWFGASSTSGDGGRVDQPDDTYAGLATLLGTFGGSWSSSADWPKGTGDTSFDFWSPVIIDADDSVWGTSASFANFGDDMIRYANLMGMRYKPSKGGLDFFICNHTLFYQFLSLIDDKERIQVSRGSNGSKLVSLGFSDAVQLDGRDLMYEYGVGADIVYGVNLGMLELASMQSTLFDASGPTWNDNTQGYNLAVDFHGNLICKNPRSQVKIRP